MTQVEFRPKAPHPSEVSKTFRARALILALSAAACVSTAAADVRAAGVRSLAAQALFDEARALMAERKFEAACPKLSQSYRIEAELGTLLNLALCHEAQGKTASAFLEYNDLLAQATKQGDEPRMAAAKERLLHLEPLLSRLALKLPEPLPPGFWLSLDGVALKGEALKTRLPLDPGTHRIRYGATGLVPHSLELALPGHASTLLLELPVLAPSTPQAKLSEVDSSGNAGGWFALGASLAVGIGGLALGTYFGLDAATAWSERERNCSDRGCNELGRTAGSRARRSARLSNVAFGVGLGGLVAGTTVYFFLPPQRDGSQTQFAGSYPFGLGFAGRL
jgi:hypothetical protein